MVLPNEYLGEAVGSFHQKIEKLRVWVSELEKLLADSKQGDSVKDFNDTCKNMHEFFIHLGARVEALSSKVMAAFSTLV